MSAVSVREFSYNPSAVFARVERGEAIEVTRHGKIIAVVVPGSGILGRYAPLIAKGIIYSPAHGDTAFTVPLFDEFLERVSPRI